MAALGLGITLKSLPQAVQVPVHFESFENTCNSCNIMKIDSGLSCERVTVLHVDLRCLFLMSVGSLYISDDIISTEKMTSKALK